MIFNYLYEWVIEPFLVHAFMRRALAACLILSFSMSILGVFLVIRRLSLVGDALSHGVLPGISLGFLWFGFNITAMSIGGIIAGICIACLAYWMSNQHNALKEDASFAVLYLSALALGVLLIAKSGTAVDLIHILFGSLVAVNDTSLYLIAFASSSTLIILALIYRPLMLHLIDPIFLQHFSSVGRYCYALLLVLIVTNLVAGFQAIGSLMSVGLLIIPAVSARFWVSSMEGTFIVALVISVISSFTGLILSYHYPYPTGPSIILCTSFCYAFSFLMGKEGGLITHYLQSRFHRVA